MKTFIIFAISFSSPAWAKTDYSSPDQILGIILLGGFMIAAIIKVVLDKQKLDDPADSSVVYLNELVKTASLKPAPQFYLRIYRQSGYLQQDDRVFSLPAGQLVEPELVITEALKTFRRAKIDYVIVELNDETELDFRRPYHDHRGVKEGKKVGGCMISTSEFE
jgi:hypothetical protein